MGCYNGLKCSDGAHGVGKSSTNSVVSASILILISNYLITSIFFGNQWYMVDHLKINKLSIKSPISVSTLIFFFNRL